MASPQIEEGLTPIAHELVEAFCHINLSAYESRVVWFILRKSFGFHKKTDRISFSQFEEGTGLKHWHVSRTLERLLSRNIITKTGDNYNLEYGIQKDYDLWENPETSTKSVPNEVTKISTSIGDKLVPIEVTNSSDESSPIQVTKSSPQQGGSVPNEVTKSSPIQVHTKGINILSPNINIQKEYILPTWINPETWNAFLEMRKKIKEPMTDFAISLVIKKLERLRLSGDDPNEVLNESIMNNWKGVFALKNKGAKPNGINRGHTQETTADRLRASIGKPLGQ